VLSPASADNVLNSYTETTAFVLPEEYRPSQNLNVLCQGSNLNVFSVGVNVSGNVNIYRYRSGNSLSDTPPGTSTWLPCNITYMIDSGTLIGGSSGSNIDIDDITSKLSKVLYDNPTGTNTTVNLSETSANFKYMDIYCLSSDNTYTTVRVHEPNGKRVTAMSGWFGSAAYFKNCVLIINEAVISVTQGNNAQITGTNACTTASLADAIKVVKVVGYYDENVLIIGSQGEVINTNKPKSIMTLKLDADVTCVQAVYTHLNLSLYSKEGEGLTYENGSVKVGKGISKVKINAQAKFTTGAEGAKHIHVDKNETTVAWNFGPCIEVGQAVDAILTPVTIDVKEGDLIDLKYYGNSKDKVQGHVSCYTFLTVEAVEDSQIITVNHVVDTIPIATKDTAGAIKVGANLEIDEEGRLNAKASPSGEGGSGLTLDMIYPIGSIYISVNSTNPEYLMGGKWERFGAGRTLVGVDTEDEDFATVEQAGGEKTHLLTAAQSGLPVHKHTQAAHSHNIGRDKDGGSGSNRYTVHGAGASGADATSPTSSATPAINNSTAQDATEAHNNLQPYITVFMWKRTE
jgi:hypothetical protein